jgi:S1-C subfamily serine protease
MMTGRRPPRAGVRRAPGATVRRPSDAISRRACDDPPVNIVDLAALSLICVGLVLGVRSGAVPQVLGLMGAAAGVAVFVALAPLTRDLLGEVDQPARALAGVGAALIAIGIGEAVGSTAGRRLRRRWSDGPAAMLDGALGGVVGVVQAVVIIWLVGALLANVPVESVAAQAQRSVAIRTVNRFMPPAGAISGEIARIAGASGLPELFVGLEPFPAAPVDLPADAMAAAIARAASGSVVRVEAAACGSLDTGTGFAIAPGVVVTNAHVVAGASDVFVSSEADVGGQRRQATVVLFDPAMDVAVLRVAGLGVPGLRWAMAEPGRGALGVALGHPAGGSLTAIPAAVAASYTAGGRDLSGGGLVDRPVLELRAAIEPGDSGGPFVLADGSVGGVIFAESRSDPAVGYALTAAVVRATVEPAVAGTTAVPTGPCLR